MTPAGPPGRLRRVVWRQATWLLPLTVMLALRLTGIRHGEPRWIYHPDVAKQVHVAQRVYRGALNLRRQFHDQVEFTMYPYGTSWLLGSALRAWSAATGSTAPQTAERWRWALWLRYVSIAFFAIALISVVLAMRARLGAGIALLVGLLLAVEPDGNLLGHYGMNDVPLLALLLPAWLCAGAMAGGGRRMIAAGAACGGLLGLAFGIKYQAILGAVFLVPPIIAVWRRGERARLGLALLATATAGVLGMLITTPLLRHDPAYFIRNLPAFMQWQANILDTGHSPVIKVLHNLDAFLLLLVGTARWLLLPAAAWGGWRAWRAGCDDPGRRALLTGAVAFCTLLGASILSSRDIMRAPDLLPIAAFLILLWGLGTASWRTDETAGAGVWIGKTMLACGAFAFVVFFVHSMQDSLALARPDTRQRAQQWGLTNLPPDSIVIRERYTLSLQPHANEYREARHFAHRQARDVVSGGLFDYAITSSLNWERFFDPRSPYYSLDAQSAYAALTNRCDVIATFTDRHLPYAHPTITVYRRRE